MVVSRHGHDAAGFRFIKQAKQHVIRRAIQVHTTA
jgi:hypothetical protein